MVDFIEFFRLFDHGEVGYAGCWPKKKTWPKLAIQKWPNNLARRPKNSHFFLQFQKKKRAKNFCWLANFFRWLFSAVNYLLIILIF